MSGPLDVLLDSRDGFIGEGMYLFELPSADGYRRCRNHSDRCAHDRGGEPCGKGELQGITRSKQKEAKGVESNKDSRPEHADGRTGFGDLLTNFGFGEAKFRANNFL